MLDGSFTSLLPFVGPLVGAAALSWVLSVTALRHRDTPGRRYFSLMLLGVGLWCLLYGLEAALAGITLKTVLAGLQYLGIASVPVFWLLFALRYTGLDTALTRRRIALLFVVPGLTVLLLATNSLHGLMWSSVGLNLTGGFHALLISHGPFFWVHLAYSYALILAGAVLLVRSALLYPRHYRGQAVLIIVAAVVPWIANLLYAVGLSPDDNFDLTPFAFAVTGAILAFALSRCRLLDLFLGLRARARSATLETMRDGVIVLDPEGRVVDSNPAAFLILEAATSELLEKRMAEVLAQVVDSEESAQPTEIHCEVRVGEAGQARILDMLASPLDQAGGETTGRLVVLRDITQRREVEEAALESDRRYRTLVENAHDLILTLDKDGRFTSVNPAVERVTGYARSELLTLTVADLTGEEDLAAVRGRPFLDGDGERQEVRMTSRDGREIVLEASVRAVYAGEELSGFECIARDVTESRHWEEALRFQALHDSVTNLSNRMHFRERVADLIELPPGDPFAVYVLDLDQFKEINDILGHQAGDILLELVASRLKRAIRGADVLARLGGDEFALVVRVVDIEEARRVALRILEVFKSPFKINERELGLSASVGIALFPTHGSSVDSLLRFADIAMYAAKRAGGARSAVYELDGDRHSPDRLTLQADLHAAFDRGELTLHYQPLVDLRRGGVATVEALVRWNHPRRGLILPSQFLDLLEQDGLADRLAKWAFGKALSQCARWRARGLDTRVSLNLSARNLDDPDLPQMISELLVQHKASPEWLTVELTESSVMVDPERSMRALAAIRNLGARVSIDDFGAGQSALPYLKNLLADEVKIDKSFILTMSVDKQDAAIVRSTIGLAHELGLSVVGEGVENEATLRLLRAYGCDYGQGYYLGRPEGPRAVARRLSPSTGSEVRPGAASLVTLP
jgi:diguanylate cyclase (GGDEF)-like protein/PAS domain S-box-containing protein